MSNKTGCKNIKIKVREGRDIEVYIGSEYKFNGD